MNGQYRPDYYGGDFNPHEPIKIIEHYDLNFNLGSVIKYVLRCGKKDDAIQELRKARQYIDFEIARQSRKERAAQSTDYGVADYASS